MSDSGRMNECCGHSTGHAIDCPGYEPETAEPASVIEPMCCRHRHTKLRSDGNIDCLDCGGKEINQPDTSDIDAATEVPEDRAGEYRETLAGMLAMAVDGIAPWIPWNCQINALRFALAAVDDSQTLEKACFSCAQPEDYGDPERHFHEPEGWHWHHYLDPGDGLPSPCANSDLLERILAEKTLEIRADAVNDLIAKVESLEGTDDEYIYDTDQSGRPIYSWEMMVRQVAKEMTEETR